MTPDRWQRIKTLFSEAHALAPEERMSFLEASCEGDPELLQEVQSLLLADTSANAIDDLQQSLASSFKSAFASTTSLKPGHSVQHYTLVDEIGRGGMGIVYKAVDNRLQRSVALKFLPPYLNANLEIKARFMQEARTASALDHQNICTIFDIGETEDQLLFMAMAYYDGQTLADRLREKPLSIEEAIPIIVQIATGLERAHDAGVIHRDIKPSNIMITKDGRVKILDFGVAKLAHGADLTHSGARIGTLAYMSPEQIRGEVVDHRTDIWSLGVLLYEMLTGDQPFRDSSDAATLYKVLEKELPPLSETVANAPAALEAIARRMLARNLEHRYGSLARLIDDLTDLSAGSDLRHLGHRAPSIAVKTGLPAFLTSFIGREEELEQIAALLNDSRLVTLTGPGGTGKTRLAIEAAARTTRFSVDRIAFVSLASIGNPDLVASAVLQALDIPRNKSLTPLENLTRALRSHRLLLILDNFEQIVSASPQVAVLLGACPHVNVLVTSRIALRLSGEQTYSVPPLPLPRLELAVTARHLRNFASVQLFEARARAARPEFSVTDANAPIISRICRRLDGIPLALELAAARIRLFTPEALLERLDQRLQILTTGPRDLPSRHQTLRQAITWSYELLSDQEQAFFRRCAIFIGGFTLEAVEAVIMPHFKDAYNALDGISALVDHNLIYRDDNEPTPRLRMLETIREFGIECLEKSGEASLVHETHFAYLLSEARAAQKEITGPNPTPWLDAMESEHDNLRAALDWTEAEGRLDDALQLASAVWRFWSARGHLQEGLGRLSRLLSHPLAPGESASRAEALNAIGTLSFLASRLKESRIYLEESLSIWKTLGDEAWQATVLNSLGWAACEQGDFSTTEKLSEEALALNRALNLRRGIAVSLNNLSWKSNYLGEYEAALAYGTESLAIRREIEDRRGVAFALTNLAWTHSLHGDYDKGFELLREAGPDLQTIDDRLLVAWHHMIQGLLHLECNQIVDAQTQLQTSAALWSLEEHHNIGMAWVLCLLAEIDMMLGNYVSAGAKLEKSMAGWQRDNNRWGLNMVALCQSRLSSFKDQKEEPRDRLLRGLHIAHEIGDKRSTAAFLDELAGLLLPDRDPELALRALMLADRIRAHWKLAIPPKDATAREHVKVSGTALPGSASTEKIEAAMATQSLEEAAQTLILQLSHS